MSSTDKTNKFEKLKEVIEWVNNWVLEDKPIEEKDKGDVLELLKNTVNAFFPEEKMTLKSIEKRLFQPLYKLEIPTVPKITTMEEVDEMFEKMRHSVPVPDEYKHIKEQYDRLENIPQPVQRSKEWFDLRNNMITASSCGAAIGESKHNTIVETLLDKLGFKEFSENEFVYHGKKYEKIATMIYENMYNTKVGEFGLIPHPEHTFVGASPDGICMGVTLDEKFSNRIGRMLEIKCPFSRPIKSSGPIDDGICPHYYWVQVQVQLECCNLEECDFWQCNLKEKETEEEWLRDFVSTHTEEQNVPVPTDERLKRGMLIELKPRDLSIVPDGHNMRWYCKYIYPPTLLMTPKEYKQWANLMIENYDYYYPDLYANYEFNKVVYWQLHKSHNVLIKRDRAYFARSLPKLGHFWGRVEYYRENREYIKPDLQDIKPSNQSFLTGSHPRMICGTPIAEKPKFSFYKTANLALIDDDDD